MKTLAGFVISSLFFVSGCDDDASPAADLSVVDQSVDLTQGSTACPANAATGVACATEGQHCQAAQRCVFCSTAYVLDSPSCTCTKNGWSCDHADCAQYCNPPALFTDPSCKVPVQCSDAGTFSPASSLPDL